MKKQYSILSVMVVLTLSFFLTSCGQKKDEALVTEYNAKKTEADKIHEVTDADRKIISADHIAWTTKLDSAGKMKADTARINGFKAEMKKHEDMAKDMAGMISDSIKAAEGMKTDNNDQLKAAIAGLDAQIAAGNASWKNLMDAHHKLGADIMAFLGGNMGESKETKAAEAKEMKKSGKSSKTIQKPGEMDESKHTVKPPTNGTPRKGSGGVIK